MPANPSLTMFLVANKADLEDKREVGDEVFPTLVFSFNFIFTFFFRPGLYLCLYKCSVGFGFWRECFGLRSVGFRT